MGLSRRELLLAGATGMVGGAVLRELLAQPRFGGSIFAPVRRDPGLRDPRLEVLTTDFAPGSGDQGIARAIERHGARPLDAYVCCLGTTIRSAGSREAFIAVDRDLVLRLAQIAHEHGARHAILVSSVGASRQSGNFYLRVKGEVEDAMERIGFNRLDLVQPGLLLGPRNERRPAEALAQLLAPVANAALFGGLQRYRAIPAEQVARAIVRLLGENAKGVFSHRYRELRSLAAGPAAPSPSKPRPARKPKARSKARPKRR